MKPYRILEGSSQSLETFEAKVNDALELGYSLAGELVTQSLSPTEVKFYQAVILEEEEDEDFADEDEDQL